MMKLKLMISTVALSILSHSQVYAAANFTKIMASYDLTPKYHGLCTLDEKGNIGGLNPHRKVRLASVTKLLTTLWAVEKIGPDFKYDTKFFEKDGDIHIAGDLDPIFSTRKLFFLISQFNNMGITEINNLTFDKNLKIFTGAEGYSGSILNISPERTAQNLKDFFNTEEWEKLKVAYAAFIKSTPKSVIDALQIRDSLDDISLKVKNIRYVEENPFKGDQSAVKEMTHLSPEIEKYLKLMNIQSNNYIADQVFEKLGGTKAFEKYVNPIVEEDFPDYKNERLEFSANEPSIAINSGSGLNTVKNGARFDNYATCAIVVRLIKRLDQKMMDLDRKIQEIVAVPGSDGGTFKSRLNTPRIANSIVAKTGTLFHTSALAGKVSTKNGDIYFGVFHQLQGWKGNAKMAQNEIVTEIIDANGGPKKFDYKKEYFFPADQILQ